MKKVIAHFEVNDPLLAPVVAAAFAGDEPISLKEPVDAELYFHEIADAITSQQLSVKAAATIWKRLEELLGHNVSPESIAKVDTEALRGVGLSYQKAGYLKAISESLLSGTADISHLHELDDDMVRAELIKLKGIGPWTADMFLIFTLGRPDVFSPLDLGLMRGYEQVYGIIGPTREQMIKTAEAWSPYRSYASLALWRHKDKTPLA